jgi:hypothetical protein
MIMKKQLLVLLVLSLGLQGVAEAKSPADEEAIAEQALLAAESQDATWGIGRRTVQPQTSRPAEPQTNTEVIAVAELEAAFWLCDYIATNRGVEATPVAICGAVYDELKAVKFAGDFGELLAWWKQNKVVEHRKIASDQRDGTGEQIEIRF